MEDFYQEVKQIYQEKEVVPNEKLDFTVETIISYIISLSRLTQIKPKYFINIMKKVDLIRFSINDDEIQSLNIDDRECKSFNFHVSEKFGIVVDEKDLEHQQYRLTHEMTHFFIKYTLDEDHQLKERNLLLDEEKSRLYEGITESITQQTWKLLNPLEESVGSLEDLYLLECEVSDILMDTMNKKLFLKYIFENPNDIFKKIKSISYRNDNLLNYLDKQMKPLIFYRGEYDKDDLEDFDILDGFEAICDCGSQLKLGGELKKDENKSKRKW